MQLTLIAALDRQRGIGRGGGLLWVHPADQRHFRNATMGHTVVMGRKTWDSLPDRFRPLQGRRNLVVTRQANLSTPGAESFGTLEAALAATGSGNERVFVIGGGELYALALPQAEELLLTEVDTALDADTHFPDFAAAGFVEVERTAGPEDPDRRGPRFDFVRYRRR